jgi:colanic acid biosynthesis glycosyl transferase WcaI
VPLVELPALLVAPDLHLITLRDRFVGFVLPSKVYACIESGKKILFIGSANSDVHLLCNEKLSSESYRRVDVSDVAGVMHALDALLPRFGISELDTGKL